MGFIQEFKEFALKGNVLDMAIGVVIGGAFGKIVTSLIDDVIMPIIGLAGSVDFKLAQFVLREQTTPTATDGIFLRYGTFISVVINFIILAFVLFIVVKVFNSAKKRFEAQPPAAPAVPPPPTKDQVLLTEIRDLLARR